MLQKAKSWTVALHFDMAVKPQRSDYIPTLDGWRAIAILWVVAFHAPASPLHTLFMSASGVFNGVYLFFALSGFLISTRLLAEERANGAISFKGFYRRRLFRIQPAALTYLLVISCLGLLGVIKVGASGVLSAALMLRNFFPIASPRPQEWYTSHFWSLAVEEHFYLLFPAFLVFVRRYRLAVLSVTVLVFAVWHSFVIMHPSMHVGAMWIGYRTDVVLVYILVGCLLAVAIQEPPIRAAAVRRLQAWYVVPLGLLFFFEMPRHSSRVNDVLEKSVYSLLVLSTVLHPHSPVSRFLELSPVRFLGRISFSLYLWQQLFLTAFYPRQGNPYLQTAISCLGAFTCAVASYYLIERPCIRFGHRFAVQRKPNPDPLIEQALQQSA